MQITENRFEEFSFETPVNLKQEMLFNDDCLQMSKQKEIQVHCDHELRNPIVNVLHNMPNLSTPLKQESESSNRSSAVGTGESDVESARDEEELSFPATRTRLRMTKPRLAKAQNEKKLLAQRQASKSKTPESSSSEKACDAFIQDEDISSYSKGVSD